jgi:hypothetical protein
VRTIKVCFFYTDRVSYITKKYSDFGKFKIFQILGYNGNMIGATLIFIFFAGLAIYILVTNQDRE